MIPNSTQIPNEIIDQWMSQLNGGEFKIVMIIARQTFGWVKDATGERKKTDWISYSQLCEKSGLGTQAISSALRKLEQLGYIEVSDSKGDVLTSPKNRLGKKLYYGITSRESREIATSLKIKEVTPNLFENQSLKIKDTKETYTKERLLDKSNKDTSLRDEEYKLKINPEIDKIIDSFEENVGHIPSDQKPRQVAQNIRQIIYTFIKTNQENFKSLRDRELNFEHVLEKSWKWYSQKKYCEDTEKLLTFKLKLRVFLDDITKKLEEERRLYDSQKNGQRFDYKQNLST